MAERPFSTPFRTSLAVLMARPDLRREAAAAVVKMYTPLWYATRVLGTSAHDWWDGGVPPARGRRQRARQAMTDVAAGMARQLHDVRDVMRNAVRASHAMPSQPEPASPRRPG